MAFTSYNASLKQLDKFIPQEYLDSIYDWNLNFTTGNLELRKN